MYIRIKESQMRTKVQRWGNSLAVRIPRALILEMGLAAESPVEIAVVDGQLVDVPAEETLTLADLLAEVTPENWHGEFDTGPIVGDEAW
jgi:antitoxin MazE